MTEGIPTSQLSLIQPYLSYRLEEEILFTQSAGKGEELSGPEDRIGRLFHKQSVLLQHG